MVAPKHFNENKELLTYDRVIANPPFSMGQWWTPLESNPEVKIDKKTGKEKKVTPNYTKKVSDPYGRLQYGVPPRGYADMAFLQHMLAVLKADGKMGVVLPHGTLFRGAAEAKIRKTILDADLVEGIVGLPGALFYNTGIPASIWVLNKKKPKKLAKKCWLLMLVTSIKKGKTKM